MAQTTYNPSKIYQPSGAAEAEDPTLDPASYTFTPEREGNPMTAGYYGYSGYGPSPYSFVYGPYGFGSYGYEPGNPGAGFAAPMPVREFDNAQAEKRQRR